MKELWLPILGTRLEISSLKRVRDREGFLVTPSSYMGKAAIISRKRGKEKILLLDKLFFELFPRDGFPQVSPGFPSNLA